LKWKNRIAEYLLVSNVLSGPIIDMALVEEVYGSQPESSANETIKAFEANILSITTRVDEISKRASEEIVRLRHNLKILSLELRVRPRWNGSNAERWIKEDTWQWRRT
jgi:hypothetical protein